jgi:outer membrane immunogenic protein
MRRFFITAVVSIAAAGAVFAADIPPGPPPPVRAPAAYIPVMPVYNWGGIYIGVNGGYGFGTAKLTATPLGIPQLTGSRSDNGGIAGGTLGFNYQMNAFVFGVEGDFDWSGINTSNSSVLCTTIVGACQSGNNWLSTLRGRFGFAADRLFVFGTAGGAFGNAKTTFNGVSTTHTQAGWTVGAGAEYAFAQNWTAKVEYLYIDLGTANANVTCVAALPCVGAGVPVGTVIPVSVGLTENLIRAGLNYKFSF